MALVVFVFSAVLMLAEGLKKTLVATGSPDNVVVIRKGSDSEIQSGVERIQASIIETQPEVAMGENGVPLAAKELGRRHCPSKARNGQRIECDNKGDIGNFASSRDRS